MKLTKDIKECPELSQELKKILHQAGITHFTALRKYTRLDLRTEIPKLKVRHLSNLEWALNIRGLNFVADDSILFDDFINQRKLFDLWEQGVDTYSKLDSLPFEKFKVAMGGPQSRFFRNKTAAKKWMELHGLSEKKRYELPHLTPTTAELLYRGGLSTLKQAAKKTDFELVRILQNNTKPPGPLTRARLTEIRYALWKEGIDRPCKPL